jgi:hypothetical protein
MNHTHHWANSIIPFRPVSHYDSPEAILHDGKLSSAEKRAILSSWASDMYALETQPALRAIPGIPHKLHLDEILAAMRKLDDENDPPPRGGAIMRVQPYNVTQASGAKARFIVARNAAQKKPAVLPASPGGSRWTREANIRRYRKLLATKLTDLERQYVERRLAEELRGGQSFASQATLPATAAVCRRQTSGRARASV